jgi:hypothetical protein
MFKSNIYTLLPTILMMSLLLTACGADGTPTPAQELNGIQTAVAETIVAQNATQSASTSAPVAPVFTQTPLLFSPTLTPLAPVASPTLPANTAKSKCASASLVSETIPDGTIFTPGAVFTKTWEIQNTSTCAWDTSYKIIFWDGNVLGGAYVYNLPQAVDPGQTVPISLIFTAPTAEATYTSKWMLQTPDSIEFGVGQYNAPFYAEIDVSASATPNYGVTSVEYNVVRDPATGCPANVNYIVYATIATSGPITLKYYWTQSDANVSNTQTLKIESATTTTISHEWKFHIATTPGEKWMALVVVSPIGKEYPRATFTKTCGE